MNDILTNVVELSRGELVFFKDVLIAVKEHTSYDDIVDELDEAIDMIDNILYIGDDYND